ncbi:MAG: hypothetical protein GY757_47080 [bacterium]|nr:hypothetical protein [bacterium]
MNNKECYEQKLDTLRAITGYENKKIPNHIPISAYIQEADILEKWCEADKVALFNCGLSPDLVIDLPVRISALIEAEARWNCARDDGSEAVKLWKDASTPAYKLRQDLINQFRFAFQGNAELLSVLKTCHRLDSGHSGMIQSLNDLSVLGKKNLELLANINFDVSLLDLAAELSDNLPRLLTNADIALNDSDENKIIRDQAYLHLKEAVDAIRSAGKFACRGDKERLFGYSSSYLRQKKARRSKKKESAPKNDAASPKLSP